MAATADACGLQQLQGDPVGVMEVDVPTAGVDPLSDLDGLVYQPGTEATRGARTSRRRRRR